MEVYVEYKALFQHKWNFNHRITPIDFNRITLLLTFMHVHNKKEATNEYV